MNEAINEQGIWYNIRLSSFSGLGLETTKAMLLPYRYILSEEGDDITTKYHQHIILVTDIGIEEIRKIIKKHYPEAIGNKCIYLKPVNEKAACAKYVLKEGSYSYNGFTEEYIETKFKTSRKKTDMKKDVVDNEDAYILGSIDAKEFIERYIVIKSEHDQPLYMNHIEAYVRKIMVRKNKKAAGKLANVLFDRIFNI